MSTGGDEHATRPGRPGFGPPAGPTAGQRAAGGGAQGADAPGRPGSGPPAGPKAGQRAAGEPGGALFWACAAVGLGVVGFGLAGLLRNVEGAQLTSWGVFFLGGLLAHDLVLAPLVALVGLVVARLLPPLVRGPVQAGLVVSAAAVAVAVPVVGGWGRLENNPSLLPDASYGRNLALVLAAVWAVVLAGVAWRALRRR